ncbi:MAG: transporter substrate-binding domain-containing protein [Clostridia bacterium]|nr:transporter substrate-binding domain-containing protein [Clostridia bacterium]
MKFKKLTSLIIVFAICLILTGCGSKNEKYGRFEDFEEKTIGVIEGTVHEGYVLDRIENVNLKYYTDHELMVKDVKKGKIDGCVLDYPVAEYYEQLYSSLAKFPSPLKEEEFCLYVSDSFNYYDEAYDIINKWKANNELEPLQDKWFSGKKTFMKIDMSEYSDYSQTRGTLTAVVDKTSIPTSYHDKAGVLQGYEVELIYKLAKELNLKPSIVSSDDFDGMLNDIKNKKYDLAAGVIVYNEERGKNGSFLPATCEGGTYILTKKSKIAFSNKEKPQYAINKLDDLDGKKVGILAGSMFESFLTQNNVLTVNRYYPSQEASIEGVAKEEVVGAICDKEIAKNACKKNPNLTYVNVGYSEYGAIFSKNEEKLVNQYNKFLLKVKMNGTLDRLTKK